MQIFIPNFNLKFTLNLFELLIEWVGQPLTPFTYDKVHIGIMSEAECLSQKWFGLSVFSTAQTLLNDHRNIMGALQTAVYLYDPPSRTL